MNKYIKIFLVTSPGLHFLGFTSDKKVTIFSIHKLDLRYEKGRGVYFKELLPSPRREMIFEDLGEKNEKLEMKRQFFSSHFASKSFIFHYSANIP